VIEDRFNAQHKSNRSVVLFYSCLESAIEQPNVDAAARIYLGPTYSNYSDLFARVLVQNQQVIGNETVRMLELEMHTHFPRPIWKLDGNGALRLKCDQGVGDFCLSPIEPNCGKNSEVRPRGGTGLFLWALGFE
jgi:hypothetical protein